MELGELDNDTPVVPLTRLRALQADFDKLADMRDHLSAALVVSELEAEDLRQERDELRDAMAALETVAARLGAQVRDLQLQRDYCRAVAFGHEGDNYSSDWHRILYFTAMTPAERARDAEERARTAGSSISLTCRICGEPLEEYEPTCARCDLDEPDIDDPDLMSKIREIPY